MRQGQDERCKIARKEAAGEAEFGFLYQRLQSSSASRLTAGALGFLTFTQCATRPERYGEPSRFETMPSQPSLQASRKTIAPSSS